MKTLIRVCAIGILITWSATNADARVIAGDLDNSVAVYYFNSQTDGYVIDYSANGMTGILYNNALLATLANRTYLALASTAAGFAAWDDNNSISISREFSIVAWVKIPSQQNNFLIVVRAYNGPIVDIADNIEAGSEGGVYIAIDANDTLRAGYVFDDHSSWVDIQRTGRNMNNNRWHHVAFVINASSMRLYLNGNRIAALSIDEHQSFSGHGTSIDIGRNARGSVDNVGFFGNDFSDAQVKLIYDRGLANIISIAPVDPNGKVATTWATLKKR